jgi:DNA-binding response OmpR family regulator
MQKRILVIDDDKTIRDSFLLALEDENYQVDVAPSGESGIGLCRENVYDLIFLDLKMPGINGTATLRELRKLDARLPIYIITAFYEEFFDELKVAEKDGLAFELVRKPLGSDQIVMISKSILEGPIGF